MINACYFYYYDLPPIGVLFIRNKKIIRVHACMNKLAHV